MGLDAARVFATLGVIWFHSIESDGMQRSGVLGRFSVSFYTMAAMVFLVASVKRRKRGFGEYAVEIGCGGCICRFWDGARLRLWW